MKILLRTTMAGPKVSGQAGQVIEAPADVAAALIESGHAEAAAAPAVSAPARAEAVEEAVVTPPETTSGRRAFQRKRG